MEQNNNEELEIDLKELFFVLLGKIWAIIGALVVGAVAGVLVTTLCITPMYESTSSLYILSKTSTLTSLTDLQLGTQLTKDYMVIAKSRTVIEQVISDLELDMTYEEFLGTVSVTNEDNTRVLSLTVQNPDPYMAKTIVDKYAEITAAKTAEIMATEIPNVVDVGVVADNPVSPSITKNGIIGGLVCMLLVMAIIVVTYLMNDSIKSADDAERYLGLTNLGVIPVYQEGKRTESRKSKSSGKHGKASGKKSA